MSAEYQVKPLFPTENKNPKPIEFGTVKNTIVPKTVSFGNSNSQFDTVEKIVDEIQKNNPNIFQCSRLKARLNYLLPLSIDKIMECGKRTLGEDVLSSLAALSAEFSKLNGGELLDSAIKAATKKPSLIDKISNRGDVTSYKAPLTALRFSLENIQNKVIRIEDDVQDYSIELSMDLSCLRTTMTVVGFGNDDTIQKAVHDRTVLLTSAVQQSRLAQMKVTQLKDLIQQQLTQIEQMLVITIPAYELARA
jgi:hypothetical protein